MVLNPETYMTPHLSFAEGVPGKLQWGRPAGIIETSSFTFVFDSARFLIDSPYWSKEDQEKLENWAASYLNWLLTSSNGQKESTNVNNHGSWYDLQVIYFALYTNQKDLAKNHLITHVYPKFKTQFTSIGSQPFELQRTRSFHYSCHNLIALFGCAILGEHLGEDLWQLSLGKEATLRLALDWLLEFCVTEKEWVNAKTDIEPINHKLLLSLLPIASRVYQEPKYLVYYEYLAEETTFDIHSIFLGYPFGKFSL